MSTVFNFAHAGTFMFCSLHKEEEANEKEETSLIYF